MSCVLISTRALCSSSDRDFLRCFATGWSSLLECFSTFLIFQCSKPVFLWGYSTGTLTGSMGCLENQKLSKLSKVDHVKSVGHFNSWLSWLSPCYFRPIPVGVVAARVPYLFINWLLLESSFWFISDLTMCPVISKSPNSAPPTAL